MTSSAMFYNKKLFDEAGLKAPTTYAELLDAAKKLTKAPNQYGMGIPTADQVQIGEPISRFLAGYDTLWGKGKEVLANSPKNVEAYEAMKGLVDAGVSPANQNNPVLRPMFWEGKSAIWWDGPWFPGMSPTPIEGLASAKIPLPSGKTTGGPQIIIMTKGGANKEAAGKYLDFISQPEWQKAMTVESGINSGRVKGVDYGDYVAKTPGTSRSSTPCRPSSPISRPAGTSSTPSTPRSSSPRRPRCTPRTGRSSRCWMRSRPNWRSWSRRTSSDRRCVMRDA